MSSAPSLSNLLHASPPLPDPRLAHGADHRFATSANHGGAPVPSGSVSSTPPNYMTSASPISPIAPPPPGAAAGSYPASTATATATATHGRTHSNTASLYQCADCQRRYSRPEHLARHIQTHTLGKRFSCQVCGKAFARQDLLKRHAANHENDDDPSKKRRRTASSPGAGRVSHACRPCAAARVKCEEAKPCTRCRNRNLHCEYTSSEAGSAAAMHLLHLSANAHSSADSHDNSPSQSNFETSPTASYNPSYPQSASHHSTHNSNESPLLTQAPPLNPEESQLPTPDTVMEQGNSEPMSASFEPNNGGMIDLNSLPFSDFLRDVIYEPGMDPSKLAEAQGLAVLDFCDNSNLELNDIDFGLLDHWNVDGMGGNLGQTFTPKTDDSIDLSQMRQTLVKVWTDSPWRWHPNKLDSGYKEQLNLPVPTGDTNSSAFQESRRKHGRVVKDRLDPAGRDRILAIVLKTCKNNKMMTRVASSFPSVDVMDSLIHIFLASHFCQTSEWIHHGSFVLNTQWPEWLAVAAAAGAVLTPVQTLRKFGFALQEAVRVTIPERFEDSNTSIKDLGLVQSLILGQDIGLWSGNRRKMEIAECHLLIPITMMRYRNKFQRAAYPLIDVNPMDEGEILDAKWRLWCERESWKRLLFHCYLRDAQTSMTTLTNPSMSYAELTLPLPEAKELWFARTASEWKMHYLDRAAGQSKRPPSIGDLFREPNLLAANIQRVDLQFAASIYLHGFWSLILEYLQLCAVLRSRTWLNGREAKPDLLLRSRHAELCKDLQKFQLITSEWHESLSVQENLMVHLLMMNLHLSLDDLQLFSGKEGEEQARRIFSNLREWSQSAEARQALWHAGQILRQAKLFPQGHLKDFYAVAVHHASLAFWTYGVVTKATGKYPGMSQYSQEVIYLDAMESTAIHRFIGIGHGKPVIRGPGGGREGAMEASLEDPRACMDAAQEILRANFANGQDALPPIVENLCQLIRQLGNAAWVVGLG